MRVKTRTDKVNKYRLKRIYLPMIVFLLLVAIFITATYSVLNYFATEIVTSYLTELVAHDKSNISDYVGDRFSLMRMMCQDLHIRAPENGAELMDELSTKALVHEIAHLYLMESDHRLYSSDGKIIPAESNHFLNYFEDEGTANVGRYFDEATQKEYMLYCLDISEQPVVLAGEGLEFNCMIMLRDTSFLRERMRVTSFDGCGYTSIVDKAGTFIVSDESISVPGQIGNCFDMLENGRIQKFSVEEIREKFENGESFTFWYTDVNNVTKFVHFSPAENSDWTFLTSIEQSVYSDQLQLFVQLIAFLTGGLFLIFMVVFMLYRFSRRKLNAFYSNVAEGVRSRPYYDDKVVDAPVTALAVVDIDHLKWINDTHGHLAGDKAIREMALALIRQAGAFGEVCRFGGDEFIIAFQKEISPQTFRTVLECIAEDVHQIRLSDFPELRMTLSIGAYHGGGTAEEIFAKADELLYEAKKTRDRIVCNVPEKKEQTETP